MSHEYDSTHTTIGPLERRLTQHTRCLCAQCGSEMLGMAHPGELCHPCGVAQERATEAIRAAFAERVWPDPRTIQYWAERAHDAAAGR